ncbi:MAG: ABC transporter ATP-binding protein [Candidatus Rokubacteria bacterium]|nr:ABC transporter ATP-binding protein [Candidatus Rokubacteria bacterium]
MAAEKLRLEQIAKTFDVEGHGLAVLHPIDLSVPEGQFLTIVGPSGCGKSTLFNIIAGLLPPDAGGRLTIDGRAMTSTLGRVGYMPQRDLLLPWRSVIENAVLGLEVQGMPRAEARGRARAMLKQFGLEAFEDFYPFALSGGMKQRVALLRTFLFESDIMLLDEPFGALDALTRSVLQEWLSEVCAKYRRTILFITHDVEEAIFLGDRVVVMTARPGRFKLELPVPLERPRSPEIVTTGEFVGLKRQILDAIREESLRSLAAEEGGRPS